MMKTKIKKITKKFKLSNKKEVEELSTKEILEDQKEFSEQVDKLTEKKQKPTFEDIGSSTVDFETDDNDKFYQSVREAIEQTSEIVDDLEEKDKPNKNQDKKELSVKAIIQAALYVAGKNGMNLQELNKILPRLHQDQIFKELEEMTYSYDQNQNFGLTIKNYGGRYKILTKADVKKEMQRYVSEKFKNPLNKGLMEVLAIVAYNQPCTRARINEIRGVDSLNLVDNLLEKGLIVEIGRADTPGRPFLYNVSEKFFDLFGIESIDDLPEIKHFDPDSYQEGNFFDSNRYDDNE
ncbi:SMC-Scp complex subunit ScpB [Mycoplasma bradburyae]|uniref:Segregation and condensation protein B n=1 Tax=Mycoplasma bradburyae TaxID=2963128 RepID=A0ABT5GAT9_9MOLU|nr:SMC-Scp complex subunit ScpB [Mycoplasma bradburyae]MDC4182008.1 SMC-Scp complex subunit ScpB [Mycoplasma bradburyae]UTS70433.1 SMC-Scp complex subunit ScpB [Mycoplasma bradburyae]